MSICNTGSDGTPSVLQAIYYTISRLGELPQDELIHVCAPPTLTDSAAVRQTLRRWTELGLFDVDDSGQVSIADPHRLPEATDWRNHLAERTRLVALAPENNQVFWQEKGNRAADFTRTLTWFLMQDAYKFVATTHANAEALQAKQLRGTKVFGNDVRWNGFKKWASFFGFGWLDADGGLHADPARAIGACVISEAGRGTGAVRDVLTRAADAIPVLDGGNYRREVREKWKGEKPSRDESERLVSTSLSRALLHLEARGSIKLVSESDAEAGMTLQMPEENPQALVRIEPGPVA